MNDPVNSRYDPISTCCPKDIDPQLILVDHDWTVVPLASGDIRSLAQACALRFD